MLTPIWDPCDSVSRQTKPPGATQRLLAGWTDIWALANGSWTRAWPLLVQADGLNGHGSPVVPIWLAGYLNSGFHLVFVVFPRATFYCLAWPQAEAGLAVIVPSGTCQSNIHVVLGRRLGQIILSQSQRVPSTPGSRVHSDPLPTVHLTCS
jgi:hypothetical protein